MGGVLARGAGRGMEATGREISHVCAGAGGRELGKTATFINGEAVMRELDVEQCAY